MCLELDNNFTVAAIEAFRQILTSSFPQVEQFL